MSEFERRTGINPKDHLPPYNPPLFESIRVDPDRLALDTDLALRDIFAAAALCGMCAHAGYGESPYGRGFPEIAFEFADAMLREREKAP